MLLLTMLLLLSFYEVIWSCKLFIDKEDQELVVDYVSWRKIQHLIILDESLNGCHREKATQSALSFFYKNNIYVSLQRSINFSIPLFNKANYKIGLVTFWTESSNNIDHLLAYQANITSTYGTYVKWLIIASDAKSALSPNRNVFEILKNSSLDLSSDTVIAVNLVGTSTARQQKLHKLKHMINESQPKENDKEAKHNSVIPDRFLPFFEKHSESEPSLVERSCGNDEKTRNYSYCLIQVYKIRRYNNTSLVVYPLGLWNRKNGTEYLRPFQNNEKRKDMEKFPLILGVKNFTQDSTLSDEDTVEDIPDLENFQEILDYIVAFLNTRESLLTFAVLGIKDPKGVWSDLLGAVVSQTVDVGLDSVIKTSERIADMSFSHNIMRSMRNIYVKPEESHKLRNVFLVPFRQTLLLSVLGTGCLLSIVMAIYGKVLKKFNRASRHSYYGFVESILWSVAIFSMQGSIFKPKTYSGNIIVVVSLLFALIIYNSYSAFITSILSVKLTNIRTVDDLLASDYDIGYTKNSQDEIYLRSINLTQLKQIYLRGYLHNNINNITEGLLKATEGNYGFFATAHMARKQLLNISSYKCKYEINEIPIQATRYSVAFPMSRKSPYKSLINLSIIKMYETGVFKYISSLIEPDLPRCDHSSIYQSAKLNDVISAFFLLFIGYISGIAIMILECAWKKRKRIYGNIKTNAARAMVANSRPHIMYQN